jgi:hypothetical protein
MLMTMMPRPRSPHALVLLVCTALLALNPSRAAAQIDSSIFSVHWEPGKHWAETLDRIVFIPDTSTDQPPGTPNDLTVFDWDSTGHIRINPEDPAPNLTLGYRFLNLSLGGDGLKPVADDLNDVALVGAYRFGSPNDDRDWRFGIMGGLGTANDGHWTNSHALYGIAALDFEHRIDAERSLHLGVEYYGNRLYLPEIPLPVVRYDDRLSKDFSFAIGFPTCEAKWQMTSAFTLDAEWTLASRAHLCGEYALSDRWYLFGEFEHDADGYFLNGTANDRMFYEFSRAVGGLRWKSSFIDAEIGLGYAFGQEFTVGDTLWDAKGLADADDGLVVSITLRGTF